MRSYCEERKSDMTTIDSYHYDKDEFTKKRGRKRKKWGRLGTDRSRDGRIYLVSRRWKLRTLKAG